LYGDVVVVHGISKKTHAFREAYGLDIVIVSVLKTNVINPWALCEVHSAENNLLQPARFSREGHAVFEGDVKGTGWTDENQRRIHTTGFRLHQGRKLSGRPLKRMCLSGIVELIRPDSWYLDFSTSVKVKVNGESVNPIPKPMLRGCLVRFRFRFVREVNLFCKNDWNKLLVNKLWITEVQTQMTLPHCHQWRW
jgi:hypothetical protein